MCLALASWRTARALPARRIAASFALACMSSIGWAHADESELQLLRQQVEDLQNTVRQLQEQVNALEKNDSTSWVPATAAPATAPTAPAPGVTPAPTAQSAAAPKEPIAAKAPLADKIVVLRTSWRHVSPGMTQAEVGQALGPPTREMLINGKVVWYYYYAGLGAGSVFFNRDGRISSSQSPNLGWGS
jgi:hypothetical protein